MISKVITILIGVCLVGQVARAVNNRGGYEFTYEKPEPHKQTYLEYVQEQLAVERLMR
jgi:hypothetical protein